MHVDIEPTQMAGSSPPTSALSPTPKAALEQFLAVAKERRATGALPDWSARVERLRTSASAQCIARPTSTTFRSSRSVSMSK